VRLVNAFALLVRPRRNGTPVRAFDVWPAIAEHLQNLGFGFALEIVFLWFYFFACPSSRPYEVLTNRANFNRLCADFDYLVKVDISLLPSPRVIKQVANFERVSQILFGFAELLLAILLLLFKGLLFGFKVCYESIFSLKYFAFGVGVVHSAVK
jgi:hypothetical protein